MPSDLLRPDLSKQTLRAYTGIDYFSNPYSVMLDGFSKTSMVKIFNEPAYTKYIENHECMNSACDHSQLCKGWVSVNDTLKELNVDAIFPKVYSLSHYNSLVGAMSWLLLLELQVVVENNLKKEFATSLPELLTNMLNLLEKKAKSN